MAKGGKTARDRAQAVLEAERRKRARTQGLIAAGIAVGAVVVIVAIMGIVKLTGGLDSSPAVALPSGSAATAVIDLVTAVPASTLDTVGQGKVLDDGLPSALENVADLTVDGKPLVLYVGAEFCPYCASQRWAVVVALSRFGTFSNLGLTHSASDDVFANTHTLTFHGSTYTSEYLVFQGVETASNVPDGNGYAALESLTAQQAQIMQTLNVAPYVSEEGTIPFMAIGNKYVVAGSSYNPEYIQDKSATEIATALSDPSSSIALAILGTANALTTAICALTGGQPGEVCNSSAARAYEGDL